MADSRPSVVLRRGRAKPIWLGHPWVYSEALEGQGKKGKGAPAAEFGAGTLVDVLDDQRRLVGRGYYQPASQIRVRMVTRGEEPAGPDLLRRRLVSAKALRERLGLPSPATDAYRLVNSEGDGLPGLIVDIYGGVVVVQFTAAGLEQQRDEAVSLLWELLSPAAIYEAKPGAYAEIEGIASRQGLLRGDAASAHVAYRCRENGLVFAVDLSPGASQKTGLFLDQRENRNRVRNLARGGRVLDAYTYHGAFALAALGGGAASVTAVDSSGRALAQASANAAENGLVLAERPLELVEADVPQFLSGVAPKTYDLVLLDPPKFVRARKDLERGLSAYRRVNALGMRAVASGGLLFSSSCSGLVDEPLFERMLSQAAADARCHVQVLERHGMGPDHPVVAGFAEGRYLKFFVCRITHA